MANILFSAYWCNPFGFSEHVGSFKWLEILRSKHNIVIFTSTYSEEGLLTYYENKIPHNVKVITFSDDNFLKKSLSIDIHFGFYTFNNNVNKFIKENRGFFDQFDIILHKSPSSFRYATALYKVEKPLILGPLNGGLQVPKPLKSYFKSESWVKNLRKLDKFLFYFPTHRKLYAKASIILITLDYLRNSLPNRFHFKTFTFFHNAVAIKDNLIKRNKTKEDTIRFLFVGRLARFKGAELAIRALSQIDFENFHFDIIGGDGEIEHLKKLTLDLKLTNKITFHGKLPRDQIDDFYRKSDIFLFPSIKEATGNVFLEAMSFSLPIISVNNGGPKYILPNEGTLRVEINNSDTMIKNIAAHSIKLLNSGELRNKMGEINYDYCRSHYTWEIIQEKILRFIDKITANEIIIDSKLTDKKIIL